MLRRHSSVREKLSVVHIHQQYVLQHPLHPSIPGAIATCPRVFGVAYRPLCRRLRNSYRAVQPAIAAHAHTQQRRSARVCQHHLHHQCLWPRRWRWRRRRQLGLRRNGALSVSVRPARRARRVRLHLGWQAPLWPKRCLQNGRFSSPVRPMVSHMAALRGPGSRRGTEIHPCVSRLSPVIRQAHELETQGWEGVDSFIRHRRYGSAER